MTGDAYVAEVLRRLPRQLIDRQRVELDLRTHLLDRMEAGATEEDAVRHMGTPEETARELMSGVVLVPASLGRRIGAFAIDMLLGAIPIIGAVLMFLTARFSWLTGAGPEMELRFGAVWFLFVMCMALLGLVSAALSVLYFPVLEGLVGQTVGKRLLGVVVVKEDGTSIGWVPAIVRRLPFLLEFFFIDAVFALFTRRRQRAFDKVAGTLVVECSTPPR